MMAHIKDGDLDEDHYTIINNVAGEYLGLHILYTVIRHARMPSLFTNSLQYLTETILVNMDKHSYPCTALVYLCS